MKKYLLVAMLCFATSFQSAHAFISTDAPILLKMLLNNVSQLTQLVLLVEKSTDQVRMMRDLHSGIHDALKVHEHLKFKSEGDLYEKWKTTSDALTKIQSIYGRLKEDKRSLKRLGESDRALAEALSQRRHALNIVDASSEIATDLKRAANLSSQKGAARLTAQGVGNLIDVSSETLRTQNESLKLQATSLLKENSEEKARNNHLIEVSDEMKRMMASSKTKFSRPRL
jgi:hypothetical protein